MLLCLIFDRLYSHVMFYFPHLNISIPSVNPVTQAGNLNYIKYTLNSLRGYLAQPERICLRIGLMAFHSQRRLAVENSAKHPVLH